MKRNVLSCLCVLLLLATSTLYAQEQSVSGKVTSAEDNSPIPGVNVIVKGSTAGTVTDVEGNYSITAPQNGTLVFTFIGLASQEIAINGRSTIDVSLAQDVQQLSEVVVTALNVPREAKTLSYATQEVRSKNLNITQDLNIKTALAGKVAGVQINGQAGSKLGQFGKVRIRGAISLTTDLDPLYVVDGVPTLDPNDVDMENVESVNVLKGPNATALYGQRAEAGVVVITTKKGSGGLAVEVVNSTTFDQVAYLPNYQNLYGRGYEGEDSWGTFEFDPESHPAEWEVFNGKRYIQWDNNYADESWGPRMDGEEYVPWYAWWEKSPYFGQTAKYVPQPDNIKDFYRTGVTQKNTVSLSGGSKSFSGRLAYTYLDQNGIMPNTNLGKHFINTNFEFDATERLKVTSTLRFTTSDTRGYFEDDYGNQTSGSFNSWFARDIEMDKMRELKDLTTNEGYSVSWNWWGPDYYTFGGGYQKAAFWFNPYTFMERYKINSRNDNFTGAISASYKISDHFDFSVTGSRTQTEFRREWRLPFFLSNSAAPELYNPWINSFGEYNSSITENNYSAALKYQNSFNDLFDVTAFIGGNLRHDGYHRFSAEMNPSARQGGLIIPDLYSFTNAGEVPTPLRHEYEKKVNSIYGNASFGFRDLVYLDLSYRQDWSSALPAANNGYGYPSVGTSFIFTELMQDAGVLSFGKIRAGWAQVGSDVDAILINPIYPTALKPFNGAVLMFPPDRLVDPNLKPAINSSFEAGFDTRFIDNRLGLSFTYYKENRKDEIIDVSIPSSSGYGTFLTNAGESERQGIEIALSGDIVKSEDGFTWTALLNFARNRTVVKALPGDLKAIAGAGGSDDWQFVTVIHELNNEWGQLRGIGYARDESGNRIIQDNGLYATEPNKYFGSVLPKFTGGFINTFGYKGVSLAIAFDFQKGGKFFSLSEMWGDYSGLLEETAGLNDNGKNVRDPVDEGGGVRVVGVNEGGSPVDMYVDGFQYFQQFQSNTIAEEYIRDRSYIKLRDVNLSYDFARIINKGFLKGASIGVVGRNLLLFGLAKNNRHGWDPSELSQTYGENGQLPGTRSYGVNVKLTF